MIQPGGEDDKLVVGDDGLAVIVVIDQDVCFFIQFQENRVSGGFIVLRTRHIAGGAERGF